MSREFDYAEITKIFLTGVSRSTNWWRVEISSPGSLIKRDAGPPLRIIYARLSNFADQCLWSICVTENTLPSILIQSVG